MGQANTNTDNDGTRGQRPTTRTVTAGDSKGEENETTTTTTTLTMTTTTTTTTTTTAITTAPPTAAVSNCSQGGNRDEGTEGGEDTEGVRTLMTAHEQTPSTTTMMTKSTTMKRTRTVTAGAVSPLPQHFAWGGFFFLFVLNYYCCPFSLRFAWARGLFCSFFIYF